MSRAPELSSFWRRRAGLTTGRRLAAAVVLIAIATLAVVGTVGMWGLASSTEKTSSPDFAPGAFPAIGGALQAPEERSVGAPTAPSVGAAATNDSFARDGGAPLPSIDAGRTIIRSAGVDLEVAVVADAFEQIRQLATGFGGYVGDSTFSGTGEYQTAYLTIRVPAERFGDALAQLRGLATEVLSISTSARDVSEEYSDLEAALRNLSAVEARYVDLLGRAGSIGDILQVQDRLNEVRMQIDRTEARRQLLAGQAELANIAISLRPSGSFAPVVNPTGGPLDAAADAWSASLDTLRGIATVLVVVAVYSWWIVPPALALGLLSRRLWRRRAVAAPGSAAD